MKFVLKALVPALLFILLLGTFLPVAHADVYDLPATEIVMNKKYRLMDEMTGEIGYLPVGAFNKYAVAGLSYTHLFNDSQGWEVINAMYAMEMQASLKKDLINGFGAKESDFAVLRVLATTNYVFSPFYTKSLLFNSRIVHSQLSFVAGGGVANFTILTAPALDLGLIQRFFLSRKTSLKLDFRYYAFFSEQKTVRNHITLVAGFAFNFGD